MYMQYFIDKGKYWANRCDEYRSKSAAYKAECEKGREKNRQARDTCSADITQCDKSIASAEQLIRGAMVETYEHMAHGVVSSAVASFGITSTKTDRTADVEKGKNALASGLARKKQCQERLAALAAEDQKIVVDYQQKTNTLQDAFTDEKQKFTDEVNKEYAACKSKCVKMYSPDTQAPDNASALPLEVTFGNQLTDVPTLKNIIPDQYLMTPFSVDVRNAGNFMIHIKQEDLFDEKLERVMVGMILKYMESFPATKLHLGVFSSTLVSLNRLSGLYNVMSSHKCTLMDKAVTERSKLPELLNAIQTAVSGPIEKVDNQNCADLHELYDQTPATEPFHLVLLHNALQEINEENLLRLYTYISGYHKYGVRFIIVDDFSVLNTRNSAMFANTLEQIKQKCTQIQYNKGTFSVAGIHTEMIAAKADFGASHIVAYCDNYLRKKADPPYLSYRDIGFGTEQKDPTEYQSISIPVGKNGNDVWSISFCSVSDSKKNIPIANLILGIPRTGKTKLIDAMIYNAAIKYSPEDVIFHLLDFKDGAMSASYLLDEYKIPHVQVVSRNNDAEEAGFILGNIVNENKKRVHTFGALSKQLGKKIENIADYNRTIDELQLPLPKMPRLIIAVDECQTLFETEALATRAQDIVRKGRSQGIHLVLSTQAMTSQMRQVVKFMEGFYVFDAVQEDIDSLLAKKYRSRVKKEANCGSYQAFASNDAGEHCEKIKISYYGPDTELAKYASEIRDKWQEPCDVLQIGMNDKLNVSAEECKQLFANVHDFEIPFGEDYQNREPAYFAVRDAKDESSPVPDEHRLYRSALLLGDKEGVATGLTASIMLAAKASGIRTYAVDVSLSQNLAKLKQKCFPNDGSITVGTGNEYADMLSKIYQIYMDRVEERNANPSKKFAPIAFIVNGAHNVVDYKMDKIIEFSENQTAEKTAPSDDWKQQDLSNVSFESIFGGASTPASTPAPTPAPNNARVQKIRGRAALIELIANGSGVGICVFLWVDKNDNSMERKEIRDGTGMKILFRAVKSYADSYMDSTFKEKMLDKVNHNMALVQYPDEGSLISFRRIRVNQYDLNDAELLSVIKSL